MTQLQKYIWIIDTIYYAGKISYKELSARWTRNRDLSDGKPLHRATFNRWRDAIFSQFGIIIECQRSGGYLYYIENREDIDEDRLKKWILDSFAVNNIIGENVALKNRILVEEVPSSRYYLAPILDAMRENRVVTLTYRSFEKSHSYTFPVEPYCVKMFDNRWYMLAHNISYGDMRIFALDRIEEVKLMDKFFKLPDDFSASDFFSTVYGIVIGHDVKPQRIVLRANKNHKHYLETLPLHHSQHLIEDYGEYADFELYLSPTYDFVMKLLQYGAMIEVLSPVSLRKAMKGWVMGLYKLYQDD